MRIALSLALLTACSEYDLASMVDPADPTLDELETGEPSLATTPQSTPMTTSTDPTEPPPADGPPGEAPLTFELTLEVADVAFLLDTTGSMGPLTSTMASEFEQLAVDIALSLPDTTFGVATFDDYAMAPFGRRGDSPFRLVAQQTNDLALVQAALTGLPLHHGEDLQESALEALHQAAAGHGYDMDCDGRLDGTDDVPPFRADPIDAFAGQVPGSEQPGTPGTGSLGGMGFRDGALPVIVYATDAPLRNPDIHDVPGGCTEATTVTTGAAVRGLGARVIGIHVDHFFSWQSGLALGQMEDLALATQSLADFGAGAEPAVVTWKPTTGGQQFRESLVDAIAGLVGEVAFDFVTIEVVDDPAGLYLGSDPSVLPAARSGDVLQAVVEVDGHVVTAGTTGAEPVVLALRGDGVVHLLTHTLWVLPH